MVVDSQVQAGARDLGLLLRSRCWGSEHFLGALTFPSGGAGSLTTWDSPALCCGRLLRCCGASAGDLGSEELRRPRSLLRVSVSVSAAAAGSPTPPGVFLGGAVGSSFSRAVQAGAVLLPPLLVPPAAAAQTHLAIFDLRSPELRAWAQQFLRAFAELDDSAFPVLVAACPGSEGDAEALIDLGVLVLLKVLGARDDLILADHLVSSFARIGIADAQAVLKTLGSEGLDLVDHGLAAGVQRTMQGQDWKSGLWQAAEAAHLKEDVKLLAKLAKASQEDVISASFWCEELQLASSLLAKASIPSEAAAAMYYRGWSLLRLGRPVAAQETLQLGSLLAGRARVKKGVAELLAKELGVLTSMSRSSEPSEVAEAPGPLVVEVQEASQAMDPGRRLLVLDLDSARHVLSEARDSDLPSDLAEQLKLRYWMLLPGPANFSWAIYDPPSSLLAVSASPIEAEQLALQSLGLIRQVRADGLDGQPPDHHGVVKEVAEALKAGAGCLLHSLQGGAASASSGTALACFLCRFGLGIPEDWEAQEPALSAEEAVDLAQGLRGSQGQHVDSAAVAFYEQSLWSELVMSRIARRSRRAADSPADGSEGTTARRLPAGTQVLKQPGDGNCLFHSLAKGLGGKETASGLRRRICSFMRDSPDLDISGTSLADWVQMVAQSSVGNYAQRMERAGEWGGAPEIAVCAHMVGINIYVYEPCGREFELVAPFMCTDKMSSSKDAVHVLYSGRMHYDAMQL